MEKIKKQLTPDQARKKFERTAKGRRIARQQAKRLREAQGLPPLPRPPKRVISTAPTPNAVSSPWSQPIVHQGHAFFRTTPTELHLQILSYLPTKDVVSASTTCQELYDIAAPLKTELATAVIARNIDRLQRSVETTRATKMPTDADTFLACMRTWTSTRGSFKNPHLCLESLDKWFSHLAGGKVQGNPPEEFEKWSTLGLIATKLQSLMNHTVSHNGDIFDEAGVEFFWDWFVEEMNDYDLPATLDDSEATKLFERIRDAGGDDIDIKGPFHSVKAENATFPAVKHNNKSSSKRGRRTGRYRLTPIRWHLGPLPNSRDEFKHPVTLVEFMLGNLELPELPPHGTFCYYTTEEWVFDRLRRSYKPVAMGLMERAAALESVELF